MSLHQVVGFSVNVCQSFFFFFFILCSRFCALSIESSRCFMHISSKFTVTAIQLHHHIQGMYSSLQIQLEYPSKPELRCARKTQHSVKPKGVRSSSWFLVLIRLRNQKWYGELLGVGCDGGGAWPCHRLQHCLKRMARDYADLHCDDASCTFSLYGQKLELCPRPPHDWQPSRYGHILSLVLVHNPR